MFPGKKFIAISGSDPTRSSGLLRLGQIFLALFSPLLLGSPLISSAVDAPISREYQIKAAFLYNFTKFVEWPPQHFASETSPIVIGVLGWNWNPFGNELVNLVRGKKVGGRPIIVKNVETPAEAGAVHVLFVPAGLEKRWVQGLESAPGTGVLTVGESEEFAAAGGIISFLLKEDNVRFKIDLESAQRAELKISAQLLKLATTVQHRTSD